MPSSSSSSSPPSPQDQTVIDSDVSSNDSKHLQTDLEKKEEMVKKPLPTKPLDLASYFNDLPHQIGSERRKRSKHSISIVRPARRALRLKGVPKSRSRRSTTLTLFPSRDEKLGFYDEDDDDDDDDSSDSEDEEDAAWVQERWNQLMDRQRLAEADVRRTILNRDRLGPSELSRWLDSDDTCTLPLPTLGVQLRMMNEKR